MALALNSSICSTLRLSPSASQSSILGKKLSQPSSFAPSRCAARLSVQSKQISVEKAVTSILGDKLSKKLQYAAIVAANAMAVMPAFAEEEKGKIFDFNLTLPIITVQFLLLMVALDNIWFKPVSKIMDSRDEDIRSKLLSVRDNSAEIKALEDESESILKAARVEAQAAIDKAIKETAAELDAKLQESRLKTEAELAAALENLVTQKEETLKSLDAKIEALSDEIIKKVVPVTLA